MLRQKYTMVRSKSSLLGIVIAAFVFGGLLQYSFLCGGHERSSKEIKMMRSELSTLIEQLNHHSLQTQDMQSGKRAKGIKASLRKLEQDGEEKSKEGEQDVDIRPLSWTRVRPANLSRDNCSLMKDQDAPKEAWHWRCLIEKYFDTVDYKCRDRRWAGNWQLCHDIKWRPRRRGCLVLSFGINNDFRFDDAMAGLYNCTVHSFDPSMEVKDHRRTDRVWFHQKGLSSEDNSRYRPRKNYYIKSDRPWQVQTLESILRDLNKEEEVMDVVKMDIELSEWAVLQWLLDRPGLLSRVRQLMVEWHLFRDKPPASQYHSLHSALQGLREQGFLAFRSSFPGRRPRSSQAEISYVNTRAMT